MAISKADAKEEIAKLVDNFRKWKTEGKVQKWKEEETIQYLILPLFEALGWNVKDPDEADYQTHIQSKNSKRPDIIFKINGVPRLIVEAKAVKEDLNTQKYIIQATNYAYLKGLTWAVLTDFESIKVFSADREYSSKNPLQNYFLDIPWEQYLNRFEELWLLSNESFEKGLIDEAGERALKRVPRIRLDHAFAADLNKWRSKLENSIKRNNREKNLEKEELGEIVQKILDRLIFIRTCEDRGIRIGDKLNALVRQHKQSKRGSFTSLLNKTYLEYDRKFNSKLFTYNEKDEGSRHLCEKVKIDDKVLYEVIEGLYKEDDPTHAYNFDIIDADVLGAVYEQYLAYLQRGPKGTREEKQKSKRKSQGIYYTPKYIVEYIVKNTLGEKLKKCKKPEDALKIRVLDPACGSGSFLIKAYDEFKGWYDKYMTKSNKVHEQTKLDLESEKSCRSFMDDVLRNCIYGVDLDSQAVEITQLNLLLKAAETRHRLPTLKNNIKCGNSLISNPEVAGDKAFDWNSEFKEIMEAGGFDVIIGNPPYGAKISEKDLEALNYLTTSKMKNYDSYMFFMENGFNLINEGARFGFIVPDTFLRKIEMANLREFILDHFLVRSISEVGAIFEDARNTENVVFVFEKDGSTKRHASHSVLHRTLKKNRSIPERLQMISNGNWDAEGKILQEKWKTAPYLQLGAFNSPEALGIIKKIEMGTRICDIEDIEISRGSEGGKNLISKKKISEEYKPIVIPDDMKRYSLAFNERFFPIKGELEKYAKEKILIIRIRNTKLKDRVIASYDDSGIFTLKTIQMLSLKEGSGLDLRYILAILNSKLINFYCHHFLSDDMNKRYLGTIPIMLKTNEGVKRNIVNLVEEAIDTNSRLNKSNEGSDSFQKNKEKLASIYSELEKLVYAAYGINNDEIKFISENE